MSSLFTQHRPQQKKSSNKPNTELNKNIWMFQCSLTLEMCRSILFLAWHYKMFVNTTKSPPGLPPRCRSKRQTMVRAQTWILAKHFNGFPKESDFQLKVEELPEPKAGGSTFFSFFFGRLPCWRLIDVILCFRGAFGGIVSQCWPLHEVGENKSANPLWKVFSLFQNAEARFLTGLISIWVFLSLLNL